MSALLAALLATQVAAPSAPTPPADWTVLPPLPWRRPPTMTRDLADFVAEEVRAGHCTATAPLVVDLAVMLRRDGRFVSVVPRAIDCPTVEQFAAGLVIGLGRSNLRRASPGWYRTSLTFTWAQ